MGRTELIIAELDALPEEDQELVLRFIQLLRSQYSQRQRPRQVPLKEEPFVGMWADRADMEDSIAWTRQVREREWR